MGKALLLVVGIVLFVYAVFDLVATPREQVQLVPKVVWFAILFVPYGGALLWLLVGRGKPAPPPRAGRTGGWTPPPAPKGPDDDPDYLRGL